MGIPSGNNTRERIDIVAFRTMFSVFQNKYLLNISTTPRIELLSFRYLLTVKYSALIVDNGAASFYNGIAEINCPI